MHESFHHDNTYLYWDGANSYRVDLDGKVERFRVNVHDWEPARASSIRSWNYAYKMWKGWAKLRNYVRNREHETKLKDA
jgi:hypothetical protein